MIFSNKELIELSGGKKYIVVDSLEEKGIWYYYLCEVTKDEKKVIDNYKIITTVYDNGNTFVKTIKDELAEVLESKFKERLKID